MPIELLWIIPIVAFAISVLALVLSFQRNRENSQEYEKIKKLEREVNEYNSGNEISREIISDTSGTRLNKIESTVELVSTVLSNQQKIIENFQGKDIVLESKLNGLKENLKEVQREYDILVSENYSLRARLNRNKDKSEDIQEEDFHDDPTIESKVLNMKIFKDTRKLDVSKISDIDDTTEINIS